MRFEKYSEWSVLSLGRLSAFWASWRSVGNTSEAASFADDCMISASSFSSAENEDGARVRSSIACLQSDIPFLANEASVDKSSSNESRTVLKAGCGCERIVRAVFSAFKKNNAFSSFCGGRSSIIERGAGDMFGIARLCGVNENVCTPASCMRLQFVSNHHEKRDMRWSVRMAFPL